MLTIYIAELLEHQDEVTALDLAIYTGCEMRRAYRSLAYMTGIVRVRRGVYARAPGVTLRLSSRADELLSCLPATSAELGAEMGCSLASVYNLISHLRKAGTCIVQDKKGAYHLC